MNWYDCQKDKLPDHEQEVLINVNGEHYIAKYDSTRKLFYLEGSLLMTQFFVERQNVFWKEYQRQS